MTTRDFPFAAGRELLEVPVDPAPVRQAAAAAGRPVVVTGLALDPDAVPEEIVRRLLPVAPQRGGQQSVQGDAPGGGLGDAAGEVGADGEGHVGAHARAS